MVLKQIFKILMGIILLVVILAKVNFKEFCQSFQHQNWNLLLLAFLSVPIWILLKTIKWKILLQTSIRGLPILQIMRSVLAGMAIGMITPGKIGELSRAFFIPSENKSSIVGLVFLDRYIDLLLIFFLASFGALHFLGVYWCLFAICVGFVGIGILLALKLITKQHWVYRRSNFIITQLSEMIKAVIGVNFSSLLLLFAVTGSYMLLSIATSYCLLLSFTSVPLMAVLNVFPVVLMTNILPITFGNLGIREGATIFLLGTYGVKDEFSLNIALSLFFLHTLVPALLGIILIQKKGMKPRMNNRINNEN